MGAPAEATLRTGARARAARERADDVRLPAMNATEALARDEAAASVARRAVDLARDELVPTDDGAQHLQRLAKGRRATLEAALDELSASASITPEAECARWFLVQAIRELPATGHAREGVR
jgi:hypothetical protein